MDELGQEFLLGDATQIRASNPRKQKTDKRDARHILKLLVEDRFPAVWQPPVENEELRQLLLHRCRLVRMRTRIKNQLDSMAKNEGCWVRARGREAPPGDRGFAFVGWYVERRKICLLYGSARRADRTADEAVREAAETNQEARLLMTHPEWVRSFLCLCVTIGDWRRFPRGKQVGSYLGLIPVEESSATSGDWARSASRQHAGALAAGGSRSARTAPRCELASAVCAAVDEQASRVPRWPLRTSLQ